MGALSLVLALVLFSVAHTSSVVPPQAAAAGFTRLVFDEEFSAPDIGWRWIDPGIWWEPSSGHAGIAGGSLLLLWKQGQKTSDTSVRSSATWRGGYFEIRAKFPAVTGSWPALWMIPTVDRTSPTTTSGELDILEWQSETPGSYYATWHVWQYDPAARRKIDVRNNGGHNRVPFPAGTDLSEYHTYGLRVTSTSLQWYFDNRLVLTQPADPVFLNEDYYLILGQQVGSGWKASAGTPAPSLAMYVDWVRVYG